MSDEVTQEQEGTGAAPELTLDDLFQREVDEDAVHKAEQGMLLETGTWITVPPWKMAITDKDGRVFVRLHGSILLGDKKGYISYRLSDQIVNRVDGEGQDTGKPDRASQNYVMARNAFKVAYGEAPRSLGQIVEYLRDYAHKVRVIQIGVPTESNPNPDGEPGNMVVAISPVRG